MRLQELLAENQDKAAYPGVPGPQNLGQLLAR